MKKRMLFICSKAPYPMHTGGQIRTYQMMTLLEKYFELDIVYVDRKYSSTTLNELEKHARNVFCFEISFIQHLLYAMRSAFNSRPLQVNYFYSKKVARKIKSITCDYDAVFCNNIRTAEYVISEQSVKKYIDFVDAISMNYLKAQNHSKGFQKLIYKIDYKRSFLYEQKILDIFDSFIIISDVDKKYLLSQNENKSNSKSIHVVGNWVEFDEDTRMSQNVDDCIVFVGKMNYEPNIVAVDNFVKNVFPQIIIQRPNTKLYIVGADPVKKIILLGNGRNIIVTGFVEDVDVYYSKSTVVIAPMLTGAGIQNKIIQAMSLGCSVVTTIIGAEGLNNITNQIAVVNGNIELRNKVLELLSNKEVRIEMGNSAREYVKSNLTFSAIEKQFNEFIEDITI